MNPTQTSLSAWLEAALDRPFAWGSNDCLLFAADWLVASGGRDPAAFFRGEYSDEAGAQALISRFGGFRALVATAMRRTGYGIARVPVAGDVGLVRIIGEGGAEAMAGGICVTPGRWACLTVRGLIEGRAYHVIAWSRVSGLSAAGRGI